MKGTIKDTLHKIGLSKKEIEVYLFLGKFGPRKGMETAKQLKMNKGQVYRILQILQNKGVIESTLEHPKRFIAVPLEKVIDTFISIKREEVDLIEENKEELLNDWDKVRQIETDSGFEKFTVIEGEKRVFNKIYQMIKETKKEFVTLCSVYGMIMAEKYGIFEEAKNHPLKDKVKFRLLTQITKDDIKVTKSILKTIGTKVNIKGRDPERSSLVFPRVVIKDRNEILLFISNEQKIESTLFTNCKSIIESFYSIFQDLWKSSANIEQRIAELESGKPASVMEIIKNPETAKKKYFDTLDNAKEEIIIVTSSKYLIEVAKTIDLIKKWRKNGVTTKIMAPITHDNLKAVKALLTCSEVRHIPVGYRETTIIDGKKLFQFNTPCTTDIEDCEILNFENVFLTTNQDYIQQTRKTLFEIWIKTHPTSEKHIQPIMQTKLTKEELHRTFRKMDRYGLKEIAYKKNDLTEKEVLNQIKEFNENLSKHKVSSVDRSDKVYYTGSRAFASIHPPENFQLPEFIIAVFRNEETSTFGLENNLRIFLKPEIKEAYQLVAVVVDNPKVVEYRRSLFEGMPGSRNIILVDRNKLDVQVYGNTLFAGWTIPIPLIPTKYVLPPGCIIFEGYGNVDSGIFSFLYPSGRNQEVWYNHLKAFVTFFHPTSKYVGSGIDGFIDREAFQISYPSKK